MFLRLYLFPLHSFPLPQFPARLFPVLLWSLQGLWGPGPLSPPLFLRLFLPPSILPAALFFSYAQGR